MTLTIQKLSNILMRNILYEFSLSTPEEGHKRANLKTPKKISITNKTTVGEIFQK